MAEQKYQFLLPVLTMERKVILLMIVSNQSQLSSIIEPRKQRNRKTLSLIQEEEMKCLLPKLA